MANYWICDSSNRILGPLGLGTLRELVASGRVRELSKVSRDGSRWQTLDEVPEVSRVVTEGAAEGGERAQKFKAAQIRSRLAAMRGRKAHEIFGIARASTLDHYRTAFFRLVKPFHRDKLSGDTHPDLRAANEEMFKFLSTLMVEAEAELGAATPRVNPGNVGIFTDHSMVNLSTMGVFLPTTHHLPLGTLLDVRFVFENSSREIKARARVVWENVGVVAKSVSGFGVRLLRLDKSDQLFIQQYVDQKSIAQVERV